MAKRSEPCLGPWERRVHAQSRACLNESRERGEQSLVWVGMQTQEEMETHAAEDRKGPGGRGRDLGARKFREICLE